MRKHRGRITLLAATILANLGVLLQSKGDYAGAEPLYRQALAIDEKALGPDNCDVAGDLNKLAGLLKRKGRLRGRRLTLSVELWRLTRKAPGPDNPDVARDLNGLALVCLATKRDYAGADSLYRRALAIDEKALGPNDPGVAIDLSNLALLPGKPTATTRKTTRKLRALPAGLWRSTRKRGDPITPL